MKYKDLLDRLSLQTCPVRQAFSQARIRSQEDISSWWWPVLSLSSMQYEYAKEGERVSTDTLGVEIEETLAWLWREQMSKHVFIMTTENLFNIVCSVNNPIKKSASDCIVQVSYSHLMLSISLHCGSVRRWHFLPLLTVSSGVWPWCGVDSPTTMVGSGLLPRQWLDPGGLIGPI